MSKTKLIDTIGLGFAVWLVGYAAGMMLFAFVPLSVLGWFVLAVLIPVAIFIAYKRFRGMKAPALYFLFVAASWVSLAVVFDHLFIVKAFNVQNYYDVDVFIYYALTFFIPLSMGLKYRKSE